MPYHKEILNLSSNDDLNAQLQSKEVPYLVLLAIGSEEFSPNLATEIAAALPDNDKNQYAVARVERLTVGQSVLAGRLFSENIFLPRDWVILLKDHMALAEVPLSGPPGEGESEIGGVVEVARQLQVSTI